MPNEAIDHWETINAAFSKQSPHFDEDDYTNTVLQEWRKRIYAHVDQFIKPNSKILELNAGTGLDALRFANQGHVVHATDLSMGMIVKLNEKTSIYSNITVQQISFDQLNQVKGKFDYVFSNFGGLNCIDKLEDVTKHLSGLLNEGAFVTWVIMPKIAPWEWIWVLKGKFAKAFRRLKKNGVTAHLEGEYFKTYYHSVRKIEKSFNSKFQLVKSEGLGVFSAPPGSFNFAKRYHGLSSFLSRVDKALSEVFPFNHWGDHVIVTFKMSK